MRTYLWLAGLVLGLCLAGPARAQSAVTFGPAIIGPIQNHVVDTRNVNVPIASPMTVPNSQFKLTSLFPNLTRMSNKTVIGSSKFPTPDQMSKAAPNYFKPFQMYRAQPTNVNATTSMLSTTK
jgi:hypothetical protein